MRRILSLIFMILISINIVGCSENKNEEKIDESKSVQLSRKEKIEDFRYMYNTIKEAYPYLQVNKRLNDIDWKANEDIYLQRIKKTRNDEEFIKEMILILDDLNDNNTQLINDENLYKFYKDKLTTKGLYDFLDNQKIVNRYKNIGSICDYDELIKRKDIKLKDVVDNKIAYMYLPKMYTNKIYLQEDMKLVDEYLKTLENHQALIIDIRGNTGGDDRYWKDIVSKLIDKDITGTGYAMFREDSEIIKNYLMKSNKSDFKIEGIEKLPKEVVKNAPKETLDMFTGFSKIDFKISSNKASKFKGKIYLLVDDMVYSSAESFAIFCKDTKIATIIGEKTGGNAGEIEPVLFDLKNSGLIVKMSNNMFLTREGICNEEFKTNPDYEVKNCDITNNLEDDECINKVLELESINKIKK